MSKSKAVNRINYRVNRALKAIEKVNSGIRTVTPSGTTDRPTQYTFPNHTQESLEFALNQLLEAAKIAVDELNRE